MDIKEFLRISMEKNDQEAQQYLLDERIKKVNSLLNNNGMPPLFKKKNFDNYDKTKNPIAFNQAKDFVDNFPESKGLLLIGSVGVGKSHLTASIVNELNNKLYENEKPLVITSNFGAVDLNKKLGERSQAIISRISSMCSPIRLGGKDWRINNGN